MDADQANKDRIILASGSPRRSELLAQIGLQFIVSPTAIDETVHSGEAPADYVRRMATEKAQAGYRRTADNGSAGRVVVIGADTAVVVDSRILGKPRDQADAAQMLKLLSGRSHKVLSAVAVIDEQHLEERCSETAVSFRELSDAEIDAYWHTGEPADKAGAYAIQGLGALFIKEIRGSYTGVVGLPLYETAELLDLFGCRYRLKT